MQLEVKGKYCHITITLKSAIYITKFRSLSLVDTLSSESFNKQQIIDFVLSCQEASIARLPIKHHSYSVTNSTSAFINIINNLKDGRNIQNTQAHNTAAAIH